MFLFQCVLVIPFAYYVGLNFQRISKTKELNDYLVRMLYRNIY